MFGFLKSLFSELVGHLPEAIDKSRTDLSACSRYYRDNRDLNSGLSWAENQVIEEGLNRVVSLVSRKYIADETADIEGLRKWARYEVAKGIRRDHGYHPVGKAFNDYVRDMPVSILLNEDALKALHDRTEPVRDFVTRFGEPGLKMLEDWKSGRIPDPRTLPASKIRDLGY
ncbi:MAG: hypothetical protein JJ979_25900 [Roseibium sp.]|nr:hypothetical protein [Roseibium sp.]